jgi:ABC-type nitrate/sulfonate/bicarbonate transport system substrate-binding protein
MNVKLDLIAFAGPPNLALFAAQANGFYRKRNLDVAISFAHNSTELREGVAAGRYQLAQSAIDNAFALKSKAHVDIAVVLGGDNSFNHLIVRPEIDSIADIKGHTVAVDAVNTAFAFQLYKMLQQQGVDKGDYKVKPAGSSPARLALMTEDKDVVAAMLSPPFSTSAQKSGFKDMGSAAVALGAYQGASIFSLRAWAAANGETLVNFLQATIEGFRWILDPSNKADVIAIMVERLKLSGDVATITYETTRSGFARDGAIDMAGVNNVLKLRAEFEGGTPAAPEAYLDLSYYRKALAGL